MNNDRRWYIIQTYSGFENSVKEDLERRIETMGQQDYIFNVLIPEEEYEDTKKDGTKVIKKRKMFPSYVFVEMIVTEKSWFIVRNTPKVTGFLGSSGKGAKPVPLPPDEINGILRSIGLMSKPVYDFNVGDKVLVVSGAFTDRVFEISAVNEEKEIVTVLIELFGSLTPTELSFAEIKKVENQE
jgi:transcriptional antiterminator NusG